MIIDLAEAVFNREVGSADIDGAHHVDHPGRRRKTRQELIDGLEFYEIADRANPGCHRGRP